MICLSYDTLKLHLSSLHSFPREASELPLQIRTTALRLYFTGCTTTTKSRVLQRYDFPYSGRKSIACWKPWAKTMSFPYSFPPNKNRHSFLPPANWARRDLRHQSSVMQQFVINSGTISRSQGDLLCQKPRLDYGQHRATNSAQRLWCFQIIYLML